MAIDPDKEELLSLNEATRMLPRINGRKPAISTLWRWCRIGLHGTKLPAQPLWLVVAYAGPATSSTALSARRSSRPDAA